jgi:hypothetical protein
MPKTPLIMGSVACFIAGIAVASAYYHFSATRTSSSAETESSWIKLTHPVNSEELVTYSSDALFKSDIRLPKVVSLEGKAKFVKGTSSNSSDLKLGYVVDTEIAPLDVATVPDKYKTPAGDNPEEKKPPLTAVSYDVVFYFILKDKDGFPLMKAASNKEPVHSGTSNHFQLFASSYIPYAVASNTKSIDMRMEAVRCITCNPGDNRSSGHRRRSLF